MIAALIIAVCGLALLAVHCVLGGTRKPDPQPRALDWDAWLRHLDEINEREDEQ